MPDPARDPDPDAAPDREPAPDDAPAAAPSQAEIARAQALAVLDAAALGDRVVVRAHDGAGARDALGDLTARTPESVTVTTRRGPVTVRRADVVAAKPVPPPPPPPPPRPRSTAP
ncbi:hypothetical protein [Curtobacterium herbarum]|uniref:Ferrous iron transport protein A n=1 Tax=Curtobacterium herbarum TaxID=150122 RepID=A0ABP4K7K5_9MICO|nr:hypothetical protein [Curtobacterium herbarum]MBM7475815.1 hypothetical protein [Curtobacterium herbarum]MCS6543725.1 hypothetical protein [Curtobacterium herbarum]